MCRPLIPGFLFALWAGVSSLAAGAEQGGEDFFDAYYLEDVPVVLSATRLVQPLDVAPAAITVIDREMIEASGAKEIQELFRLVPGMEVGYRRGWFPTVSYHGMSDEFSRGMEVLVDGRSIYQPSFGGVAWYDLPVQVEDIERIEVIRGPNAAAYGPKSFMGVINIITSHAAQTRGVMVGGRFGERGYRRGIGRYGGSWGNVDYRVTVAHQEDDGFFQVNDARSSNHVQGRFDYHLSPRDTLLYNFGFSEGPKDIGSSLFDTDPERSEDHFNIMQQFRWEHYGDAGNTYAAQFTHNRQEVEDRFLADGVPVSNNQLSERYDGEFQHTLEPGDAARLVWGVGARLDRTRLPFWFNTKDDKTDVLYRAFANFEWRMLQDLTLNLGALLEKNSYTGTDVSPRLAFSYRLSDRNSFRFIASRSLRTPNIGENRLNVTQPVGSILPLRIASHGKVKPEEALTLELGHHGQFFDRKFATDLKLARQSFNRLVTVTGLSFDPVTGDPLLVFGNGDSATSYNVELQLDYRPSAAFLFHLGYSWVQISGSRGEFDYNDSAPTHNMNLLISRKLPYKFQLSGAFYYRSSMSYIRSVDVGDFKRIDVILAKHFRLSERQRLSLSFIHQNALGGNRDFVPENRWENRSLFEVTYRFD